MIKLIKQHYIKFSLIILVLLLDIFICYVAVKPTNKEISAPGGLNEVHSFIETDTNTVIKGSFSTVYVVSIDDPSILQTWVASLAPYNEISDVEPSFDLGEEANRKSGKILKNHSLETSVICSYIHAKKYNPEVKLEATLKGYIVYTHQINHQTFEIGDLITEIYSQKDKESYDSLSGKLAQAINNLSKNDIVTVIRDDKPVEITINEDFSNDKSNRFFCVYKYDINQETVNPKYQIKSNIKVLGSSGGLLQTLSLFSQVSGIDVTAGRKICGTGTISVNGTVGKIGSVGQKIVTAIHNNADVFLCPEENYEEALKMYNKTPGHEKMELIMVKTFEDALIKLGVKYEF